MAARTVRVATFFHCDHRRPRYRGETRWGVPDGRGERFYANGNVYLGQWEAGKRHGYGELRGPRGSLLYAGMWENDSREGHGIQFYGHGGAYYEGGWLMGLQSGWGRRLYDNGAFYEGGWWAGKREGPGLFRTKEGDFFQGVWRGDARSGPGRRVFRASGQMLEGTWSQDRLVSADLWAPVKSSGTDNDFLNNNNKPEFHV